MLSRMGTHKFNVIIRTSDRGQRPDLHCGQKFYYCERYKDKDNFVPPKYQSLKIEIMRNRIHRLDHNQYERVLYRANQLLQAQQLKSLAASGNQYGIEKGSPITLNHIVALVLYSEHEQL